MGALLALALALQSASVRDLDDDDIEVRDTATRAIASMGLAALDLLRAAAPQSRDGCLRVRQLLETLERRLRWLNTRGGPVVEGLQATLRLDVDSLAVGDLIDLQLDITNVSESERLVAPIGTIEAVHAGRSVGLAEEGTRLFIRRKDPERMKILEEICRKCEPERSPRLLLPRESLSKIIPLAARGLRVLKELRNGEPPEPVTLEPGDYELEAVYQLRGGAALHSNVVKIRVDR
jgi:hypothetical protein